MGFSPFFHPENVFKDILLYKTIILIKQRKVKLIAHFIINKITIFAIYSYSHQKMRYLIVNSLIISFLTPLINTQHNICSGLESLSNEQIWNAFIFTDFNRYFILVAGSISVVLLTCTALTWVWYRSFSIPSDIMLVIVISEWVQNFTQIIEVGYQISNEGPTSPPNFQQVCSALGFFTIMGNVTSLYYNAFFCTILAYSIRNTLKKALFNQLKSHFLTIMATATSFFVIIFTQNTGKPLVGICIYKIASQSTLGLLLLHLVIVLICTYSVVKFKRKIPHNSYFKEQSYFGYYFYYMILYCVIEYFNCFLYLLGKVFCKSGLQNSDYVIKILFTISIFLQISLSYVIFFLRFSHPVIKIKVRTFLGLLSKQEQEQINNNEEERPWLGSLVKSIRGSQILSFISAIMINFIENQSKCPNKLTSYHFQKRYCFILTESVGEDYIRRRITNRESHFTKQRAAGIGTLDYEVMVYTPEYYSSLFKYERNVNLFKSFDIHNNLSLVKEEYYEEGGKSGQFFFTTYDHQFIFKTIQQDEAEVMIDKTEQFSEYYLKNPDSLIIKILGLYKFSRLDIQDEVIYLMLMKNLTQVSKNYNMRVYDIKGSEFNRSALTQQKIKPEDTAKLKLHTLKDLDFLELEGKIHIQESVAQKVQETLIRDIQFLSSVGVMDYSFLIIKRQGPSNYGRGYAEFPSTQEENIYYNFGIIDYLEEWTLQRKAERVFKTMITNSQVTAQSPVMYSKRLIQFIKSIF